MFCGITVVGDTRFELVTSSVSGRRSFQTELIARETPQAYQMPKRQEASPRSVISATSAATPDRQPGC
jgi:hypothetical protein